MTEMPSLPSTITVRLQVTRAAALAQGRVAYGVVEVPLTPEYLASLTPEQSGMLRDELERPIEVTELTLAALTTALDGFTREAAARVAEKRAEALALLEKWRAGETPYIWEGVRQSLTAAEREELMRLDAAATAAAKAKADAEEEARVAEWARALAAAEADLPSGTWQQWYSSTPGPTPIIYDGRARALQAAFAAREESVRRIALVEAGASKSMLAQFNDGLLSEDSQRDLLAEFWFDELEESDFDGQVAVAVSVLPATYEALVALRAVVREQLGDDAEVTAVLVTACDDDGGAREVHPEARITVERGGLELTRYVSLTK